MMKQLRQLITNKTAATAAEYAMILAIVGAAIIIAALGLSGAIANEMTEASSNIAR
jgi:pilus assembly protein Flp/PilA